MNNRIKNQVPMLMVRMRCPACRTDHRMMVEFTTPIEALPELTKQTFRCNCKNHIPKINKNTPLETSLMSINGVPYRTLLERGFRLTKEESPN